MFSVIQSVEDKIPHQAFAHMCRPLQDGTSAEFYQVFPLPLSSANLDNFLRWQHLGPFAHTPPLRPRTQKWRRDVAGPGIMAGRIIAPSDEVFRPPCTLPFVQNAIRCADAATLAFWHAHAPAFSCLALCALFCFLRTHRLSQRAQRKQKLTGMLVNDAAI